MSKRETIVIKIISALLLLLGVFLFIATVYRFIFFYQFGQERIENYNEEFSVITSIISYHYLLLLGITGIISGIFLFKRKKTGYFLSILSSALFGIYFIKNNITAFLQFSTDQTSTTQNSSLEVFLIILIWIITLFLPVSTLFLLKKRLLNYFKIDKKDKLILILIFTACIIDHLLFSSSATAIK